MVDEANPVRELKPAEPGEYDHSQMLSQNLGDDPRAAMAYLGSDRGAKHFEVIKFAMRRAGVSTTVKPTFELIWRPDKQDWQLVARCIVPAA